MKYSFFIIPVFNPKQAEEELNSFLSQHRVVGVEKELVSNGSNSCWSLCVQWVEQKALAVSGRPKNRVDYKELLSDREFSMFVKLRSLRKEIAEKTGVPPYVVFTNEQLAEIVRKNISPTL